MRFLGRRQLILLFGAAVWFLTALAPPTVRADVVAIVPPHAEPGIPTESIERAVEALTRALRADGFDVVSPGQAAAVAQTDPQLSENPAALENCTTPECGSEFRRLFDANFAVQLSFFREGGGLGSITLAIVEQADAYFTGACQVEGGDIEGSVRTAYRSARARQAEGVGPWLTVVGSPQGANVYIDGLEFGHVPFERRRIGEGPHRVEIRADGYGSFVDSINIPRRLDHEEKLEASLAPLKSQGRHHVADWVVGGVLTGGGLVYVASGVRDLMLKGHCFSREQGACVEQRTTGTITKLKLGLGAGAAALGIFTLAYGPIGVMTSVSRETALLRVRMQF